MGIFNDILDFLNETNDYLETYSNIKEEFDDMESAEILDWFSRKIINYESDFSKLVEGEGEMRVSYVINKIESISEDIMEEDIIRLMAKLQYASSLTDGIPNVLAPNPTKAVTLLRLIIQETQSLNNDYILLQNAIIDINARACYVLGICFLTGNGCPQSDNNALKYIRKAANAGLSEAEDFLDMIDEL